MFVEFKKDNGSTLHVNPGDVSTLETGTYLLGVRGYEGAKLKMRGGGEHVLQHEVAEVARALREASMISKTEPLKLGPGDILVLIPTMPLDQAQRHRLKNEWANVVPNQIVVSPPEIDIRVISRDPVMTVNEARALEERPPVSEA